MIIYKTTNKLNGKIYVGKDEKNKDSYYGSGLILKRSIKKNGKDNFVKETLEVCSSREELSEREIYWINKLDSTNHDIGYNITKGGTGGDIFSQLSEKRKEEIKEKGHKGGWHHTEETKNIISEKRKQYLKENPISEELKEKYRNLYSLKIPNDDICQGIFKKHFDERYTIKELSKEYNYTDLMFKRIFEHYSKKVKRHRKGALEKTYPENHREIEKEIVKLYVVDELLQIELQQKFSLPEITIHRILKRNKVLKEYRK